MSRATKRKHVVKEVLGDFITPTENQQIVKVNIFMCRIETTLMRALMLCSFPLSTCALSQVIGSRGNNLHETVTAQGETFLVSMPTKFRKNIWIKRGNLWSMNFYEDEHEYPCMYI
ncbi:hypothetical protein GOODEAATRI_025708 [Goodea atripinnis]|uniref:Probable RNA-binding protein EIF1AD n=1 Tax=Goodea atripinnis TaxID=208336 RepID=A0ABV0NDJ9_9TELE